MNIHIEKQDKYALIIPTEHRLDAVNTDELKQIFKTLVQEENFRNFVLDLSEVKYVDSSGLSAILVGNQLCQQQNGSFVVCCVGEHVQKILSIAQLDRIINVLPTRHEAIESILMDEIARELNNEDPS